LFTYKFVENQWVMSLNNKSFNISQLVSIIKKFFIDQNLTNKVFIDIENSGFFHDILAYTSVTNLAKDKSGKLVISPDMFKSFVNIMLDRVQSAAYCRAWKQACLTHDVKTAKGLKEIEKYSAAVLESLSVAISDKPNMFK